MDEVNERAKALNAEIRNSLVYQEYIKAKEKLMAVPEKYNKFEDFNKSHLDFQARKIRGEMHTFDEEKYIASLYAELFLCEDTRVFMEARNHLLSMVSKAQEIAFLDVRL